MAQKVTTVVEMTDDIDGSKAEQTLRFAIAGTAYEIDLSKKNAAAFSRAVKPYIDNARKVRNARRRASTVRSSQRPDLADIRAWAHSNGYQISARGRIPASIKEAFDAR